MFHSTYFDTVKQTFSRSLHKILSPGISASFAKVFNSSFPRTVETQASSWGAGRDISHWVREWLSDYKVDDEKSVSEFLNCFGCADSCVQTCIILKENSLWLQHSPSLVLNGMTQFRKCFTIDFQRRGCSTTKSTPFWSQKTITMIFLWYWVCLNIFWLGEVE